MSNKTYLFVAPHLDDVVLSCGGYVHRLKTAGERVVIATVITADRPPQVSLSRSMRYYHRVWRLGNFPFEARRREDVAAIESLNAEWVHLGLVDAIYRCDSVGIPLYSFRITRVPVHSYDLQCYEPLVCQKLEALLSLYGKDLQVFCPLAAGGHIDHKIVRRAVEEQTRGTPLNYYEDYPYAGRVKDMPTQLASDQLGHWQSVTIRLTPQEIEARIKAATYYDSMLTSLFPAPLERIIRFAVMYLPAVGVIVDRSARLSQNRDSAQQRMATAIRAYIARVGGERYWQCHPSAYP